MLHTDAYWLMFALRDAIPKLHDFADSEFSTLRLLLIKIAARVIDYATCVCRSLATGCSEADLFRGLPGALVPFRPRPEG